MTDVTENPNAQQRPERLIVNALIMRHAEDAAFYWMQRSSNTHSPLLRFDRLSHFDILLNAHLDGLRVAGDFGWECALKNLQRWRRAGEAFVAYVLAIDSGDKIRLQVLWEVVERNLDVMQDGLVSALGWIKENIAVSWMDYWLPLSSHPRLQQIALQAFAVRRLCPDSDISGFFASPDAGVRAAVCELAGSTRMVTHRSHLQRALKDDVLEVCEAAAIALALHGDGEAILPYLWKASLHLNEVAQKSKGWTKSEAIRRAEMLARQIGHALPVAYPGIPQLLEHIPPRQGLIALAHHGDPAVISIIINAMSHMEVARLAGWAFSMITGVDLDQQRLSALAPQSDENEDERTTPLHDPDIGLSWPHPSIVNAWWRENGKQYAGGQRLLLGRSAVDPVQCFDVLKRGTQAERWAAAMNLAMQRVNDPLFATDAQASAQRARMASLIEE